MQHPLFAGSNCSLKLRTNVKWDELFAFLLTLEIIFSW